VLDLNMVEGSRLREGAPEHLQAPPPDLLVVRGIAQALELFVAMHGVAPSREALVGQFIVPPLASCLGALS